MFVISDERNQKHIFIMMSVHDWMVSYNDDDDKMKHL